MIWIRIFRTRHEAEWARKFLSDAGFNAEVNEDKLFGIPIQKFGVPARFRLMVSRNDYEKIAEFLAGKLKP